MKSTGIIVGVALALYLLGYMAVRSSHYSGVCSRLVPDNNGKYSPENYEATCITLHWEQGLTRISMQALYWVFYPAGRIDEITTGREYTYFDERWADPI